MRDYTPKWTTPPWEVGILDENAQRIVRSQHIEICTCWHHSVGAIEKEMEANARLISHAPEMYLLLRRYMIVRRERMIYAGEFIFNGYACRACGTDWAGPMDAVKEEFHHDGCFFSRVHDVRSGDEE